MIQVILISVLHFVVTFLESAFSTKGNNGGADDFFNHSNGGGARSRPADADDDQLLQAYEILELTPPTTLEQTRKQWKKLSLRHHPDRNNGSQESHDMQQKLNEAFRRVQESLTLDSNQQGADEEMERSEEDEVVVEHPPAPDPQPTYEAPFPPERPARPQDSRRQPKKQARKAKRQARREREEQFRWEMQAELRAEQRRIQESLRKLDEEIERIRRETFRLADFEQREAANRIFMDQVQNRRRLRRRLSNPTSFEKPRHYVMDSCTNELVVAMRLGLDELAASILDEQVGTRTSQLLQQPSVLQSLPRSINYGMLIQRLTAIALPEILLQRLDDDSHTLLHYAVYWERTTMMVTLCDFAKEFGILDKVFLAENSHGYTAMDYAWIAKDPSILSLMQSRQQTVQQHLEETQIGPAIRKAASQIGGVVGGKFDIVTTINTVLAHWVGIWGFRCHWFIACMGIPILQSPGSFTFDLGSSTVDSTTCTPFWTFLISIKVVFWVLRLIFSMLVAFVRWEVVLLMIPPMMLCGCFSRGGPFSRILELIELPLFLCGWATTTLVYRPLDRLEFHARRFLWRQQPKMLRQRPALYQTMALTTVLVLAGMIRLPSVASAAMAGGLAPSIAEELIGAGENLQK